MKKIKVIKRDDMKQSDRPEAVEKVVVSISDIRQTWLNEHRANKAKQRFIDRKQFFQTV